MGEGPHWDAAGWTPPPRRRGGGEHLPAQAKPQPALLGLGCKEQMAGNWAGPADASGGARNAGAGGGGAHSGGGRRSPPTASSPRLGPGRRRPAEGRRGIESQSLSGPAAHNPLGIVEFSLRSTTCVNARKAKVLNWSPCTNQGAPTVHRSICQCSTLM